MFEKEDFEKYMKDSEDYYDNREPMTERKLYQLWKDGAEFGYTKAVDKMKCCGNCKNLKSRFDRNTNIIILYCSDPDMKQIEVGFQMCCCKWEIKEND